MYYPTPNLCLQSVTKGANKRGLLSAPRALKDQRTKVSVELESLPNMQAMNRLLRNSGINGLGWEAGK